MELYPVYVLHSDEWDDNKFVNSAGDCVIIESTFSYNNLVEAIDFELNTLEITFLPKDGFSPIVIYNDTGVWVYI
ncbi:hypothetical protein A4A49_64245, partial [Nicotiana attenuata]